jgi:hypothetical protein
MNFLNSYETVVESAYIITLPNSETSQQLTKQCVESCEAVGQPYKLFEGFDGTTGQIVVPEALRGQAFVNFLRLHNQLMTPTQIAVFYSHYALWCLCVDIDRPIVILEHDAMMEKPYLFHKYYNNIVYLGSSEQKFKGAEVISIPPHGTDHNGLWRFICRAHAYAIDPAVAKNMISYVIQQGITTTLDVILRADIVPIIQDGIYAYDNNHGLSTIHKEWI